MTVKQLKTDALLVSLQVDLDTIGLKQLHHLLQEQGFVSRLLFLPGFTGLDKELLNRLTAFVADLAPGFIGISLMSHEFFAAAGLTAHLKRVFPQIPVVWGGIHPTIVPEVCLEYADYTCVGEGETAIVKIAAAIRQGQDPGAIANIFCRRENGIVRNPPAPLIDNLDELPAGAHVPPHAHIAQGRRIVPLDKYNFKRYARWRGIVYSVMGSRGCPFSCAYCCNDFFSRLYGAGRIRRRSVTSIISELSREVQENPGIEYINFQDDCFLACSDEYLAEFCAAYGTKVRRPFIVRCIPSFINQHRLRQLKAAGLAWISMGLQSGSDRILRDIYNRRSTSDQFFAAARLIHRLQIAAYYDVIVDNPLETDADRRQTIRLLTAVPRPYFLQLFSLTLYPGTALRERILRQYPERAEAYLHKNYHRYQPTPANRIIRMSAYMPPVFIRKLAAAGGRPDAEFRFVLTVTALISALIMEPLAYFRVLRRSQQGSLIRTVRQLPAFFRIGVSRYMKQFPGWFATLAERIVRDDLAV
ncbi:MAG: B12-binding domain-containing radical SAM protein, partial [Desulfosudaceae bacterium]